MSFLHSFTSISNLEALIYIAQFHVFEKWFLMFIDGDLGNRYDIWLIFRNISGQEEHCDPNSYSWCLMRYTILRSFINNLRLFLPQIGIELSGQFMSTHNNHFIIKNKKHSENADTSMSVTFDLVVWPWSFVKVKKADVIKCRLLYCTLVPGMMSMGLLLYEISPFVYLM